MIDITFLLSHFPDPVFPRTIFTFKSTGKQLEVFDKEEMMKIYQESNFVDSRVNAYPSYTEYKWIQRYPPNLTFPNLDRSLFISNRSLERALSEALKTIWFKINGFPTVLWTGIGYHIYQPIDASILEQFIQFEEFENPSVKFIRFAEDCLTRGKSDPFHNPSFKSCMMRIPGSLNSKYPTGRNKVTTFQKWNSYRPSMNLNCWIFTTTL